MAEVWKTTTEWAAERLPGLPASRRGFQIRVDREGWERRYRQGRGGGWEYPLSALPNEARAAYLLRSAPAPVPAKGNGVPKKASGNAVTITTTAAEARAWQLAVRDARLAVLAEIDRLMTLAGSTQRQAILVLVEDARSGKLREDLMARVPVANARAGADGKRTLSRSTLYEWLKAREAGGSDALLPAAPPAAEEPAWAPFFLKVWRDHRNPAISDVLKKLPPILPDGMAPPSYDQARHFLRSLPPQERERGRKGPRAIMALRQFKRRDTSQLEPTSVYTSDGKLYPAKVMNPLSGLPFKPEVTAVLDVATRRAVGWSAALSENANGVSEAFRRAVMTGGVPAIWYTDNGPGFDNVRIDDPLTGHLARLGTVNMDSLPDRSQSRGIIERFQQTWTRAARQLPSYLGKDMDPEAYKLIDKRIERDVKQSGASRLVMPWADFLAWCDDTIADYNATPHRALPKTDDPITGRRRHMSPDEAWQSWVDRGWRPVTVDEAEADDLFRPYEVRTTNRAEVQLIGNIYFHPALEPYHGRRVAVGYDIHQAERVWVREVDEAAGQLGRLICVAEWMGHLTRYVPLTAEQLGKEQRVKAAGKRLEDKRAMQLAELDGPRLLTHEPAVEPVPLTVEQEQMAAEAYARLAPEPVPTQLATTPTADGRPRFANDGQMARWVIDNPDKAKKGDAEYLRDCLKVGAFRMLLEDMEGVQPEALREVCNEILRGAA